MNKKKLLNKVLTKKTKDYIYLTLFFLIASFFTFFAIKPSLEIAFTLNKKKMDLKTADDMYESVIVSLLQLQSNLEKYRTDLVYLDQAIPMKIRISGVLSKLTNLLEINNLTVDNLSISNLELVKEKEQETQKLRSIAINLQLSGDFPDFVRFLKGIQNERRLKVVKKIVIDKGSINIDSATKSGSLKINLQIESYFL